MVAGEAPDTPISCETFLPLPSGLTAFSPKINQNAKTDRERKRNTEGTGERTDSEGQNEFHAETPSFWCFCQSRFFTVSHVIFTMSSNFQRRILQYRLTAKVRLASAVLAACS